MAFPLLVFTSISILIFLYIAYKLYKKSAFKLPPGPRPRPVIGNLYNIKPVTCQCFDEWSQAYGPIISVWFGSNLNVIASNSELAREVLKENDQQLANRYRSRSIAKFNIYGKDLTWADYGPHFVKVRKVCALQLFSPKRLEALRPIREYEVTAMVESIFKDCTNPDNKGRSQVVRKYLGDVALNNISRIVLGKRFMNAAGEMDEEGKELESIVANGVKLATLVELAHSIPWWLAWILPLKSEGLSNYEAQRDRFTQAIMNHHILLRQNTGQTNHHFVDALLTHKEEYGLSHDTIIGLLWNMISAGKDTSAITVEWAMGELIKNPRVQQKAQEELDHIIGPNRVLTESDFQNLPYLQCIIKEALRLHPPTPLMLPHRPATDVKIGGYDVPMGSTVHVNVWALARDPAVWKSPLEFRPERFIEEDVDIKGHDFRLLPFGAGRRVCPGAQLGINMVTLMLGQLLHHFNWAPPEGVRPKEIDMAESPGLVSYMSTPLEAVPTPRLHEKIV